MIFKLKKNISKFNIIFNNSKFQLLFIYFYISFRFFMIFKIKNKLPSVPTEILLLFIYNTILEIFKNIWYVSLAF